MEASIGLTEKAKTDLRRAIASPAAQMDSCGPATASGMMQRSNLLTFPITTEVLKSSKALVTFRVAMVFNPFPLLGPSIHHRLPERQSRYFYPAENQPFETELARMAELYGGVMVELSKDRSTHSCRHVESLFRDQDSGVS